MSLSRRNAASESKEKPWRVIRNQKTSHQNRMGCGRISQRAAQGSLYRGAGRQRRSERLKVGTYAQGRWPYIFLQSVTALFPSPDCDSVGDVYFFFANCDLSSILVILSIAEYNKSETSKFPFFEVSESSDSKNRFF